MKNIFKNKLIVPTILFTLVCTSFGLYFLTRNTEETIQELYRSKFADKEATLWQEFAATENVTKEAVEKEYEATYGQYTEKYRAIVEKNYQEVSGEMQEFVHGIMKDFGIDPKDITIAGHTNENSPAYVDDFTLWIHEEELLKLTPCAQKYIIAHELSHLLAGDHAFNQTVKKLVQDKKLAEKYNRFIEARADITAMTRGAEYAQGAIEFFTDEIQNYGDYGGTTHPRNSERIAAAKTVLSAKQNSFILA